MATDRVGAAPEPGLPVEAVAGREFASVRRGYDPGEVRRFLRSVADDLARVRAARDDLRSQLNLERSGPAPAPPPPPELTDEQVVAAVGEEMAAALRASHAAARDLRAKAAEEAEGVVAEARRRAEEIGAEADVRLSKAEDEAEARLAEAAEEAERRLAEADSDAEATVLAAQESSAREAGEVVARARAEAEELRRRVEAANAAMVEGATADRERILGDLARRRRVATVQIEQLRAGRERLLQSYAVVRETLQQVNDELQRADAEARSAADEVGRRLHAAHDAAGRAPAAALPAELPEVDEVDVAAGDPTADTAATGGPDAAATDARQASGAETDGAVTDAPVTDGVVKDGAGADPAGTAAAGTAAAGTEEPATGTRPGAKGRRRKAGTVEEAPAVGDAPDGPVARTEGSSAVAVAAEAERLAGDAIRGGGLEVVEEDAPPASPSAAGIAHSDADELHLQRRDGDLEELIPGLTRRLKRALQDEHNDLLDRLRSLRGTPTLAVVLPPEAEQAAALASVATPFVADAATAGARLARDLGHRGDPAPHPEAGARRDGDGTAAVVAATAHLASSAAFQLVGPLRRRIDAVLSDLAGEPHDVIVDALASVYREVRSQRVERLAGDTLTATYAEAVWHAVPDGVPLRWLADDVDGPCADCDDNVLAGPLAGREAYPTGQLHPPAHSGCRCLLVPDPG